MKKPDRNMIVDETNKAIKSRNDVLISIDLVCLWPLLFFAFLWLPQLWNRSDDGGKDVDSDLGAMAVGMAVGTDAGVGVVSSGFCAFLVTMVVVVIVGFYRRRQTT